MYPLSKIRNDEVRNMALRAQRFLASHRWCAEITEGYLAWALADKCGVFFFRLIPSRPEVDRELWVIVGDIPPAYIVCDNARTWQEALDAYGVEMMKWVDAVREGQSVEGLIPVNAPATAEYAEMLCTRIEMIREMFVDVPPETMPTDL
jgi:hypothetical protein